MWDMLFFVLCGLFAWLDRRCRRVVFFGFRVLLRPGRFHVKKIIMIGTDAGFVRSCSSHHDDSFG